MQKNNWEGYEPLRIPSLEKEEEKEKIIVHPPHNIGRGKKEKGSCPFVGKSAMIPQKNVMMCFLCGARYR